MKENLIQIASNIKTGEEIFKREHFSSVVARVHGEFDGKEKLTGLLCDNLISRCLDAIHCYN